MMGIVSVHNLKLYGYHGCLPEEAVIGTNYRIDVDVYVDFSEAAVKDDLTKTVDYVVINRLVKEEMAIRSNLIEQVGHRIIKRIRGEYPKAEKVWIRLYKMNPPANGDIESVSVTLEG
ncbi:MAG: dihydroneopterin aldolase [Flavobacteriales bacterium]